MLREALGLRVDAEGLVPGNDHVAGCVPPGRSFLELGFEVGRFVGVAGDRVGGGEQVSLREQIREDVVVGDRAVFVRTRDPVDAKAALRVVVAERKP